GTRAHGPRAAAPAARARRPRLAAQPRDPALLSAPFGARAAAPQGDLREQRRLRDRARGPGAARTRRVSRGATERSAAAAVRRPREGHGPRRAGAQPGRGDDPGEIAGRGEAPGPLARHAPILPQVMSPTLTAVRDRLDAY